MVLWSLDDYWYYALFTLCMLVAFEAMLCFQRQKSLEMLRSMRREPIVVYALRAGRWQRVSSEAVTPGEVVSIVPKPPTVANAIREARRRALYLRQQQRPIIPGGMRGGEVVGAGSRAGLDVVSGEGGRGMELGGTAGDDEALVPFDVLLMRGSCVVNEAMLTGESVPQAKASLASVGVSSSNSSEESWIGLEDGTDSPHRKHIIFGGTKVSVFWKGGRRNITRSIMYRKPACAFFVAWLALRYGKDFSLHYYLFQGFVGMEMAFSHRLLVSPCLPSLDGQHLAPF